jgi:hypothetical protein
MQGVHNKVLGKLRELQGEHQHNPPVFALLLELDHRVSGAARLGDSLVVIGGGGALRRWDSPKSLFTVLQGAQSRISEYQRVELERVPVIGINGPAVEAVTHLLAELLDNATTFSPPSTTVRVSAERGPAGVYLDIVDRGVGMAPDKVAWARQLLAGETSVSLEDLGETPHVGLTVATLLARQCGIRLELSRSGLKGTRASVLLPDTLLTAAPDPDPVRDAVQGPDQSPAPVPVSVGLAEAAGDAVDESKGRTPTGLPRRRIGLPDSPGAPQPSPSGASGPEVPPAVRRDAMTVFAQRPAAAAAPPAYPSNSELSSTEDK